MAYCASRRDFLGGMAAMPLSIVPAGRIGAGLPPPPARDRPVASRPPARMFGTAVRPDQLAQSSRLRDAILADCRLLVPEYHGQWSAVEWRRGDPWFGNYDAIAAFAAANAQTVRGHSLLWEQMTPDWVRSELKHHRDWRVVEAHFAHLLPRYRGAIGEWVVVNEMIDTEHGHGDMRRTGFQRAFGNDYVRRALESARALDPDATLIINDYSLEHDNPVDRARRAALLRLVERLKRLDVPLDMVGVQGHIEIAKGPVAQRDVARFLRELADMGVTISITEMDVLEADRTLPPERRDAIVDDAVRSLLDVALDQPAVKSVVTWGMSDRHSWLQDRATSTKTAAACTPVDCAALNRGLPYDAAMAAKPMRAALDRIAAV